jgi:hypothetical protein
MFVPEVLGSETPLTGVGGHLEVISPAVEGQQYTFNLQIRTVELLPGEKETLKLSIYRNETLLRQDTDFWYRFTGIFSVWIPEGFFFAQKIDLSLAFEFIPDVKFGQRNGFFVETHARADGVREPPPFDVTYSVQIVEGNEWGTLYSFDTDETADTLSGLPQFNGRAYVSFFAGEEAPSESARVVLRVTASDGSIEPATTEFRVLPVGCLAYEITPAIIAPGDTAAIFFREELPNGTVNEYPPDQLFDVSISGGAEYGTLLFEGDTASVWNAIGQGVQFIAASAIVGDSAVALIVATLFEWGASAKAPGEELELAGSSGEKRGKAPAARAQMLAQKGESAVAQRLAAIEQACQAFGVVVIKEERLDHFLLLGESKYYQAKLDPEVPNKLVIEEVGSPSLNGGIAADVWGANPLSVVSGDKIGVYWEKFKPVVNATSVGNEQLPTGLIRLVGRYWDYQGKEVYKVRLTASYEEKVGSRTIEVKKPARLLSPGQSPSYEK